jgi:phosphohistidine swiveling domain-containing protein
MLHPAYDLTFYEFDDERDAQIYEVLLCDLVHGKPPFKPLYIGLGWYWYVYAISCTAETLHLPTTKGWDYRVRDGYPYITAMRTTEEEAKAREPIFREKIRPFIEDFDGVWDPFKTELLEMYKEAKESRGLREWDDIKKLSNIDLLKFLLDFSFVINRKEAEIHMLMLVATYYINGLFQQMWHDIFGTEAPIDPDFGRLMTGYEAQDSRVFRELWKLSRRAVDMGLEDAFEPEDNEAVLKELDKSDKGKEWLKAYREFLVEHGWRCERMHAYDNPAWIEKPSLAIGRVKLLLSQESFAFDAEHDRHVQEREKTEKEVLAKLPAEQKEWFSTLMKSAQKSGYWSEDHTYFCDFYVGAMGRWIVTEFGRRFAEAGCLDDPEDIHFLHIYEIRKAAIPMGNVNLRPYVERRKEAWEKSYNLDPPPFYGDIEKAQDILISDPTLSVSSQVPIVREELKADLYGAAAAPGVVEGVARVIMGADRLSELNEGEILVAPGTSAAWTVAFSLISGLITDGGGALSHPVIMAREYGLPCVAGCVEGTQKIKTGQRVKIDGNLGIVFILDK